MDDLLAVIAELPPSLFADCEALRDWMASRLVGMLVRFSPTLQAVILACDTGSGGECTAFIKEIARTVLDEVLSITKLGEFLDALCAVYSMLPAPLRYAVEFALANKQDIANLMNGDLSAIPRLASFIPNMAVAVVGYIAGSLASIGKDAWNEVAPSLKGLLYEAEKIPGVGELMALSEPGIAVLKDGFTLLSSTASSAVNMAKALLSGDPAAILGAIESLPSFIVDTIGGLVELGESFVNAVGDFLESLNPFD